MKMTDLSLKIYQETEDQKKRRDQKEFLRDWETRIYQTIDVLGSATYLIILYIYYRRLNRQKLNDRRSNAYFPSEVHESATLTKRRMREASDNEGSDGMLVTAS